MGRNQGFRGAEQERGRRAMTPSREEALFALKGVTRFVARVDWHVPTQTQRIELIDPSVIACFGTARSSYALQLRQWLGIKRPALTRMLAGRLRPVEAKR